MLYGIIIFEKTLPLSDECLDKEFPIKISGCNGILATPRHMPEYYKAKKAPKNWDKLLEPVDAIKDFYNKIEWGQCMGWPSGYSEVSSCALWFDVPPEKEQELGGAIFDQLEEWRYYFILNLSALSLIPLMQRPQVHIVHINGAGRYHLMAEDQGIRFTKHQTIHLESTIRTDYGIDLKILKEALDQTSNLKKPVGEFNFLLDSIEAYQNKDYRKSVLEAATALELCLNTVIKSKLEMDEDLRDEIMRNYNSISRKRQFLKVLKVALPNHRYTENFEKIRNGAVHIGRAPTKAEAQLVYKIAADVLNTILPEKFEEVNEIIL